MDQRQVFTRKEIEKDLKHTFKKNFVVGICILPLISLIWVLFLSLYKLSDNSLAATSPLFFELILLVLITAVSLFSVSYYALKTFSPLTYIVVTDNFLYEEEHHSRYTNYLSLHFKCYGEYVISYGVGQSNRFYTWSKKASIYGSQFKGVAARDEEFYLIIVDNRIAYLYSTRVFRFDDTNKETKESA